MSERLWANSYPRKGYVWSGVVDNGPVDFAADGGKCNMCGYAPLRFVHFIRHEETGLELEVGFKCAEHLCDEDAVAEARAHEEYLTKRNSRIKTLVDSPRWTQTKNGNWRIDKDGYRAVIFPVGQGHYRRYSYAVYDKATSEEWRARRHFAYVRNARYAVALDIENRRPEARRAMSACR